MSDKLGSETLVGVELSNFKVVRMTEVYDVDEDGRRRSTLGFFKNQTIAEVFAGPSNTSYKRTAPALILTDGVNGYVIPEQDAVKLFNDEVEAVALRKIALAKLTLGERSLLGHE
jgi:hypothetical protein